MSLDIEIINPSINIFVDYINFDISFNESVNISSRLFDISNGSDFVFIDQSNVTSKESEILTISGNSIYLSNSIDYETNSYYTFTIIDSINQIPRTINIYIKNSPPTQIYCTNPNDFINYNNNINSIDISFNENIEMDYRLFDFSNNDPNGSNLGYYVLTDSSGNNESNHSEIFTINGNSVYLKDFVNYETKNYYQYYIKFYDSRSSEKLSTNVFPLNVYIKNILPAAIPINFNLGINVNNLTLNSIDISFNDFTPIGYRLFDLYNDDPNGSNEFFYKLVSDVSGDILNGINSILTISGNSIYLNSLIDLELSKTYTYYIRCYDISNSLERNKALTVNIFIEKIIIPNLNVKFYYKNQLCQNKSELNITDISNQFVLDFEIYSNDTLKTSSNFPDISYGLYRDNQLIDFSQNKLKLNPIHSNSSIYIVKVFYLGRLCYYTYIQILFPYNGTIETAGQKLIPWVRTWFYKDSEISNIFQYYDVVNNNEIKPAMTIDTNGYIYVSLIQTKTTDTKLVLCKLNGNNVLLDKVEISYDPSISKIPTNSSLSITHLNDQIILGYQTQNIVDSKYEYTFIVLTQDLTILYRKNLSGTLPNFPYCSLLKDTKMQIEDNGLYFSFNIDISGYDSSNNIINLEYDISNNSPKTICRIMNFGYSMNFINELPLPINSIEYFNINLNQLYYNNNSLYVCITTQLYNTSTKNIALLKYQNNELKIFDQLYELNTPYDESNMSMAIFNNNIYLFYSSLGIVPDISNNQFGEITMVKLDLNFKIIYKKLIKGSNNLDYPLGVHIWNNNLYLVSLSNGLVDGILNTRKGINNIVVYRITLDGEIKWARQYNDFNKENIYAGNIEYKMDNNGNIFIVFTFINTSSNYDTCLFKMIHPEYIPTESIDISGTFWIFETIIANVSKVITEFGVYLPSRKYQWQYFISDNLNNFYDPTFWVDIYGANSLSYTIDNAYYKKHLRFVYTYRNKIEDDFIKYSLPTTFITVSPNLIPKLNYTGLSKYLTFNPSLEIPFPTATLNADISYNIRDFSNNSLVNNSDLSSQLLLPNLRFDFINKKIYNIKFIAISYFGIQSDSVDVIIDAHESINEKISNIDISNIELSVSKFKDGSSFLFGLNPRNMFAPISDVYAMNFIVQNTIDAKFKLQIYTKSNVLSLTSYQDLSGSDNIQLLTFQFLPDSFKLLNLKEYHIKLTCLTESVCTTNWFGTRQISLSPYILKLNEDNKLYPCLEFYAICTYDIILGHEPEFYKNGVKITQLKNITKYVKPHIKGIKIKEFDKPDYAIDFSNNSIDIITNFKTDAYYKQGSRTKYFKAEDKYGRETLLNFDINIYQDLDGNNYSDQSQNFIYVDISKNIGASRNLSEERTDIYIQTRKTRFYKNGKASLKAYNNSDILNILELNKHTLKNIVLINLFNKSITKK